MDADARSAESAAARPVAEPAGQQPASRETMPTAPLLSRQSTDFGLGGDVAMDPGSIQPAGPDPLAGRDLGDVVLGRLIAQGGMGRVYEAQQRSPVRTVAVKLMRPGRRSPAAVQRFRREADLLGRLRHPGIAQVFTAGSCLVDGEETPYFVMEFVAGAETLVRACERRGLAPRERLETFHHVCRAVAHGHAAGIVHRDLKPGNILVDGDGRPKVIDFGIARLEEDDAGGFTETGAFLGTRQYSSPEQCEGATVDARTDVYALGVILHELLSGRLPYTVTGTSLAETTRIVRDAPPARLRCADRALEPGADAIALKCLAKRPGDRYPSAAELAADLDRLLAGRPISARAPGWTDACRGWCRRHKTATASGIAAGVSAVIVALAVWYTLGRPPGPQEAPARAVWRMPPDREIAFNLLGEEWKRHVVSMEGVEFATERNAGATSFIRPTKRDREGSIVLRFESPFEIRAATLTAAIAVWTTGDPFPYDPRAKAALDVSPDGKTWTTLETREANRGGFGGGPFDIREFVAGSRAVWVRARLTASKSWPEDGLIHAQFLRSDPGRPAERPFRLTLTGPDPAAKPPPGDTPPADG
jgi:hypothetical protein